MGALYSLFIGSCFVMRGKPRSKQKTGPSLSLLTFPFFTITTVLLFTLKHEVTLMIPIRYVHKLNLFNVRFVCGRKKGREWYHNNKCVCIVDTSASYRNLCKPIYF